MSTETNERPVWDAERITDLRAFAERTRSASDSGEWAFQLAGMQSMLSPSQVLSLLDELECARAAERSKNAELSLASEQLAMCAAELECARLERDIARDALHAETTRGGYKDR